VGNEEWISSGWMVGSGSEGGKKKDEDVV